MDWLQVGGYLISSIDFLSGNSQWFNTIEVPPFFLHLDLHGSLLSLYIRRGEKATQISCNISTTLYYLPTYGDMRKRLNTMHSFQPKSMGFQPALILFSREHLADWTNFDYLNYGKVTSIEYRPGMLLNILQCTGQSHTTKNYLSQKSRVIRSRTPGLRM